MDIWTGDPDPIITHGRTLTTSISARAALVAIAQYAFLASPYPLILSLEIHCDQAQQDRLVGILEETLGERLLREPVGIAARGEGVEERLPSPCELRGRVLIKVRTARLLV